MSIGIKQTDSTLVATPDKAMTKNSQPKILTATFGDGYEQRVADGINTLNETYDLSFKTRTKNDIDDIVLFLDTQKGVSKFILTLPDSNNTTRTGERDVKVVSTDYSVNYEYDNFYTLSLTLKRVFEA
jgi:phage-related protein